MTLARVAVESVVAGRCGQGQIRAFLTAVVDPGNLIHDHLSFRAENKIDFQIPAEYPLGGAHRRKNTQALQQDTMRGTDLSSCFAGRPNACNSVTVPTLCVWLFGSRTRPSATTWTGGEAALRHRPEGGVHQEEA